MKNIKRHPKTFPSPFRYFSFDNSDAISAKFTMPPINIRNASLLEPLRFIESRRLFPRHLDNPLSATASIERAAGQSSKWRRTTLGSTHVHIYIPVPSVYAGVSRGLARGEGGEGCPPPRSADGVIASAQIEYISYVFITTARYVVPLSATYPRSPIPPHPPVPAEGWRRSPRGGRLEEGKRRTRNLSASERGDGGGNGCLHRVQGLRLRGGWRGTREAGASRGRPREIKREEIPVDWCAPFCCKTIKAPWHWSWRGQGFPIATPPPAIPSLLTRGCSLHLFPRRLDAREAQKNRRRIGSGYSVCDLSLSLWTTRGSQSYLRIIALEWNFYSKLKLQDKKDPSAFEFFR